MGVRVLLRDLRSERMCSRGARVFASRHGIDWNDFIQNGIDADVLTASGDVFALRAVKAAETRIATNE